MIFVECKPDGILTRRLVDLPRSRALHEIKGKSGVCKRVSRQRNCTGVVDEDPTSTQPDYLTRLRLSEERVSDGLKVYEDDARHNRIVMLCPRLEEWVLRAATDAHVDVTRHGLPNTGRRLHGVINVDLRKFERLLDDLLKRSSNRIGTLARILRESPTSG